MAAEQTRSVVVMGGGPAGVFSACVLIDLGIPVTLITRSRPFVAWEGLSERPRASLCHFGFERTLKSLGPMVARTAHWNGVSTIQNREYIVERRRFDQALLEDAAARGVEIVQGRIEQVSHQGSWHISCRTAHGQKNFRAGFLVDARGREARFGRKFPGGNIVTAPATAAVLKSYRVSRKLPAMTAVATFASGWAWYLRDGNGRAILQIFVEGGRGNLPGKAGLEAYFSRLVRELPEAAAWLDGARARINRFRCGRRRRP
ncbi:MAG: hypothetical protein GXP02_01830 [Alphaproteobacteria bacterium]|nr:hypothetical protein [Alphaproteobacteria bacterium]